MTTVIRRPLVAGAEGATGTTVVIDVFRAFTTAAVALAGGVGRLVLAAELDEARGLAADLGGAVLVGEEQGRRPGDFHLGNSPAQVWRSDLEGATVVLRTSAGTAAVRAARRSGAEPLWAASLVVATATARAVQDAEEVTLVAAGSLGRSAAIEDEECADYIGELLGENPPDPARHVEAAYLGPGGRRLLAGRPPDVDPADLGLCLAVDLFDFAMRVETDNGLMELCREIV